MIVYAVSIFNENNQLANEDVNVLLMIEAQCIVYDHFTSHWVMDGVKARDVDFNSLKIF